mgnify:CR=1 FL=1
MQWACSVAVMTVAAAVVAAAVGMTVAVMVSAAAAKLICTLWLWDCMHYSGIACTTLGLGLHPGALVDQTCRCGPSGEHEQHKRLPTLEDCTVPGKFLVSSWSVPGQFLVSYSGCAAACARRCAWLHAWCAGVRRTLLSFTPRWLPILACLVCRSRQLLPQFNVHVQRRPFYFSRHGQSEYNALGTMRSERQPGPTHPVVSICLPAIACLRLLACDFNREPPAPRMYELRTLCRVCTCICMCMCMPGLLSVSVGRQDRR